MKKKLHYMVGPTSVILPSKIITHKKKQKTVNIYNKNFRSLCRIPAQNNPRNISSEDV